MNVPSHMMEPMTEPVNRFRHNCNVTLRLSSFNCILFDRGILMGIVLQLGYHWSINTRVFQKKKKNIAHQALAWGLI